MNGIGLYVGCGNGRNFIPLVNSGLNLVGIDISKVAIEKLSKTLKDSKNILCEDFRTFETNKKFDYIIAIQVFQHGLEKDIKKYFDKVYDLLKSNGLFFLRVNSVSTSTDYRHSVIENNKLGGVTILYQEGPKKNLNIHFFSLKELNEIIRDKFEIIERPHKQLNSRHLPKAGNWMQWEMVLKKKYE